MTTWSEWYDHDGSGCPVAGRWVQAVNVKGGVSEGLATGTVVGWVWLTPNPINSVIRYRTRVYRAGIALLDSIREAAPA